jgi:hypothetical protein
VDSKTDNFPAATLPGAPPSHEARLLAQLLRSGRVVLLLGEPQADRSALIQQGLVPMLARRSTDQSGAAGPGTYPAGAPRPERRSTQEHRPECIVIFDRWTCGAGGTLQQLRHSLAAALGVDTAELAAAPQRLDEALVAWTQTRPVHLLLLLHRFEDHLLAPHPGHQHAQVTDELVRLLNRPGLPVSVLLSLTEAAQPYLSGIRSLVPGLEDMSLRLKAGAASTPGRDAFTLPLQPAPAVSSPDIATMPAGAPAGKVPATDRSDIKRGPVDRPAICSDDVYALINSTLSRVATGSSANPMLDGRAEASEPDIEAFQATPPSHGLSDQATEPAEGSPMARNDETLAVTDLTDNPNPAPRAGWWRRLLQRLGRQP